MSEDGWHCINCGWATCDLNVMKEQVLWPVVHAELGLVYELVCPRCGIAGQFEDCSLCEMQVATFVFKSKPEIRYCRRCFKVLKEEGVIG